MSELKINYRNLSDDLVKLQAAIAGLDYLRTGLMAACEPLAGQSGEAINKIRLLQKDAEKRISVGKDQVLAQHDMLSAYKTEMGALLHAKDESSDVSVDPQRVYEDTQELLALISAAFTAPEIPVSYEMYWTTDWEGDKTPDWNAMAGENSNGDTISALKTKMNDAWETCERLRRKIDDIYQDNIKPFQQTDMAYCRKIADLTPAATTNWNILYDRGVHGVYAKLMPNGEPDWNYLRQLMGTDRISQAELGALARMLDALIAQNASGAPIGNLELFLQFSYIPRNPDDPECLIYDLSPVFLQVAEYCREHNLHEFATAVRREFDIAGPYTNEYVVDVYMNSWLSGMLLTGGFPDVKPNVAYMPDWVAKTLNALIMGINPSSNLVFNYRNNSLADTNHAYNMSQAGGGMMGFINGQGATNYRDLKYGNTDVANAGCGVIAVHNAMALLGKPAAFADELRYFETHGALLYGKWGTNPLAAVPYLQSNGFSTTVTTDSSKFDALLKESDVAILTVVNEGGQTWHTMAIVSDKSGGLVVYNRTNNNQSTVPYVSIDEFLHDKKNPIENSVVLVGANKR
jgi:hypothetical protein